MSSHHIVLDQQEPALFVHQLKAPDNVLLKQLLEWNPLIIGLNRGVETLILAGIKVDVAITTNDSNELESLLSSQHPIEVIQSDEQNFLRELIRWLGDRHHDRLNIWSDQLDIIEVYNLSGNEMKMELVLITNDKKQVLLQKPFKKWYPSGTRIGITPLLENQSYTITGVISTASWEPQKWVLENDGVISVESTKYPLGVTEEIR